MPLRNVEEYHRWVERESPSVAAQRVARHFLAEIGDETWRSPSVPIEELSNQPEYEVRAAAVEVARATIGPCESGTATSPRLTQSTSSPSATSDDK